MKPCAAKSHAFLLVDFIGRGGCPLALNAFRSGYSVDVPFGARVLVVEPNAGQGYFFFFNRRGRCRFRVAEAGRRKKEWNGKEIWSLPPSGSGCQKARRCKVSRLSSQTDAGSLCESAARAKKPVLSHGWLSGLPANCTCTPDMYCADPDVLATTRVRLYAPMPRALLTLDLSLIEGGEKKKK